MLISQRGVADASAKRDAVASRHLSSIENKEIDGVCGRFRTLREHGPRDVDQLMTCGTLPLDVDDRKVERPRSEQKLARANFQRNEQFKVLAHALRMIISADINLNSILLPRPQ